MALKWQILGDVITDFHKGISKKATFPDTFTYSNLVFIYRHICHNQ